MSGDSDVASPSSPTKPSEPETPHLDFQGTTPYEDYVQADVLTHLQHPLSDDPGEMVFLVTTQVMELWFTVIVHEWETAAQRAARGRRAGRDGRAEALRPRAGGAERLLAPARPAHPRPVQLLPRRPRRGLRLPVGDVPADGVPARREVRVHARPAPGRARASTPSWRRRCTSPASTTRCCGLLARRGHAGPATPSWTATSSQRYEPSAEVEAVWTELYAGPDQDDELARLGEALTDVAELVWRWRNDHLVATRRAMGAKTGTGGSAGVAWLEKRATKNVFPELWTARSHV